MTALISGENLRINCWRVGDDLTPDASFILSNVSRSLQYVPEMVEETDHNGIKSLTLAGIRYKETIVSQGVTLDETEENNGFFPILNEFIEAIDDRCIWVLPNLSTTSNSLFPSNFEVTLKIMKIEKINSDRYNLTIEAMSVDYARGYL